MAKRRSWKNDYLKLEKRYESLEKECQELRDSHHTIVNKLKKRNQEVLSWRDSSDKKSETIEKLNTKIRSLKKGILDVINKYHYFFSVAKVKKELQDLL